MKDVTLAVIAGGAGSRMGGPKWGLMVEGRPVLERLVERMAWEGPMVLVLGADTGASPDPSLRSRLFLDAFTDIVHDERPGEGPVAGILGALRPCETEWMVCVPVDMPGLSGEHARWLAAAGARRGCTCCITRRQMGGSWQLEPFPLLVRCAATGSIDRAWRGGLRAMRDLGSMEGAVVLDAPQEWGEEVWVNLNTPGDLRAYGCSRGTMESRDGVEGGES